MDRLSKIALGRFYFSPIFVQKIAVVFAYFSMWSIWNLEKATKFVQLNLTHTQEAISKRGFSGRYLISITNIIH